jgi:hypothetical protein
MHITFFKFCLQLKEIETGTPSPPTRRVFWDIVESTNFGVAILGWTFQRFVQITSTVLNPFKAIVLSVLL